MKIRKLGIILLATIITVTNMVVYANSADDSIIHSSDDVIKEYTKNKEMEKNKEEYTKYTYELDENEKPTGIIAKTTSTGTVIDINGNAYDETKTDTRTIGITIE